MEPTKTLPLAAKHLALGAEMTSFGGWEMPLHYGGGIVAEHKHTRAHVSLFDCSHMGQFRVAGKDAAADLDLLLARGVGDQTPGTCRYDFLLTETGAVRDDLVTYCAAPDEYCLVVNAGPAPTDAEYLSRSLSASTSFRDETAGAAKLDIQGPEVLEIFPKLRLDIDSLPGYYGFIDCKIEGVPCRLSRTGYTGELGFELYCEAERAAELWDCLLSVEFAAPAGLGARDTLRLEMGYPLYGRELGLDGTPVEAGYGWMLASEREFVGRDALARPPRKVLAGVRFAGRRAARAGAAVYGPGGERLGVVTSGSFAPSLGCAIALAYVQPDAAVPGTAVEAEVGSKRIEGVLVERPFYRGGSARRKGRLKVE